LIETPSILGSDQCRAADSIGAAHNPAAHSTAAIIASIPMQEFSSM
jgi:hypothetical protein